MINDDNQKGSDIEETLEEPEEILDESGTDTTDWKAEALKNYGRAKRYQTDLKKYKETEAEKAKAEAEKAKNSQDKKDFDLAEKSYLLANGVKKSEISLFWEEHQKTGRSIDELLESEYFREKREMEASKEATPSGTKRAGGAARDSVDYWVKKGEYPPNTPENTELRRKVAKALASQEEQGKKFSPRPIV